MSAAAGRPNVVLVLADDMGFSDLGVTGSEIRTPVLDDLARDGALFPSMYNCARCCPTRAALLTGLYPHCAGIGHMGADLGTPAYQGHLRNDAATLAETLRAAGYRTLMSGKWHVGGDFSPRDADHWRLGDLDHPTPRQRGFDRFYGIVDGATSYFSPHCILENDTRIEIDPEGFYFTDAITDRAIAMIEEGLDPHSASADSPFFLYLAHAAPHWPLHALPEDIAGYEGVYDRGWDVVRTARHEELNARGVLSSTWAISPRDPTVIPWAEVEEAAWEASRMAVYAAMVERMDRSLGRLVSALRRLGQFDNTLILFLSDNGGCAEFMAEDGWAKFYPDVTLTGERVTMGNRPDRQPGDARSFQSYDRPWANVSNAPFRLFKHYVHEGGIATPLIAHWPARICAPRIVQGPWHVIDVLPTVLSATRTAPLTELDGHPLQAPQGESFLDALVGPERSRQAPIFFEHEGNAAVRAGNFKLVREHGRAWELYDMDADRTELNDLAGAHASLAATLQRDHAGWSEAVGVQDWDRLLPRLLAAWRLSSADG